MIDEKSPCNWIIINLVAHNVVQFLMARVQADRDRLSPVPLLRVLRESGDKFHPIQGQLTCIHSLRPKSEERDSKWSYNAMEILCPTTKLSPIDAASDRPPDACDLRPSRPSCLSNLCNPACISDVLKERGREGRAHPECRCGMVVACSNSYGGSWGCSVCLSASRTMTCCWLSFILSAMTEHVVVIHNYSVSHEQLVEGRITQMMTTSDPTHHGILKLRWWSVYWFDRNCYERIKYNLML